MLKNTSKIRRAVVETYRETVSAEERIDKFLDFINEAKSQYEVLDHKWENLNEHLESFISKISDTETLTFILSTFEGLISRTEILIKKIKSKKDFYSAIKNQVDTLEENIAFSNELRGDIKLKIDPQIMELGIKLNVLMT